MKILILGAGAVGGYFGARLHNAGGDVTFLVRPARAAQLRAGGLQVLSPLGNTRVAPKLVHNLGDGAAYDVIILSCKAYDLETAMEAVTPGFGADTMIVPLLNGLAHLDALDSRFGRRAVHGGFAHLSVALTNTGEVTHLGRAQRIVIGPRSAERSVWLGPLSQLLAKASVDYRIADNIEQEMWNKFVFLSTLAAATCTMRASIGDILDTTHGRDFVCGLLQECVSVAEACRHADYDGTMDYGAQLFEPGSDLTASMLRDIELVRRTEGEHVLGDMVRRGAEKGVDLPLLKLAYAHIQAYELRRVRAS